MINTTVHIYYIRNLHLIVDNYSLLMNSINCHQHPLSCCPKERSISINIAEVTNRGDYHRSHNIFL